MLRTLLSIIPGVVSLTVMAHSMSVTSYELDETDLTPKYPATKVIDQNGETCALIRIQTKVKGQSFDVGLPGVTKTVDNEHKSLDSDGSLMLSQPRGTHSHSVQAPGYASQEATFTLGVDNVSKNVRLESVMASLNVSCATPGASIFVNDRLKFTADVREGETTVLSGALEKAESVASASGGVGGGTAASSGASTSAGGTLEFNVKGVRFVMVAVQGGTFTMGATPEQGSDVFDWEKPVHKVTLSSCYIGQTEVTQELWTAVMGSNPSWFKGEGANLPVECVSWNDCQEFIEKLNAITGRCFRLPTEAEWEYAARGGNKSRGYKYSGGDDIDAVAWYSDNSGLKTHAVATKSANELGIYDMSGNVWEWCQDWYGGYSSAAQTNPTGPTSGSGRVYRGGSWNDYAKFCRSSFRDYCGASFGNFIFGLRLALSE